MNAIKSGSRWSVLKNSVPGASHIRSGTPNQDSIGCFVPEGGRSPVVVAVADGHGSAKCFRSQRGAAFAVKIATSTVSRFLKEMRGVSPEIVKREAETRLPVDLVREWVHQVRQDLNENPFKEDELAKVEQDAGKPARQVLEKGGPEQSLLAYGTTLILAALTKDYAIFLQLGDGDVLIVWDHVLPLQVESPMPDDPGLIANETTSLCMPNAHRLFRFRFKLFQNVLPALIIVSTDGYSNSFATKEDFTKIGPDYLARLRSNRYLKSDKGQHPNRWRPKQRMEFEKELKGWLESVSQQGSGDDVTAGLIIRCSAKGSEHE
jgi:hypothetical protein